MRLCFALIVLLVGISLASARTSRPTLEMDERRLEEEFLSIERETRSQWTDSVIGLRGDNIYKNRYEDILPNENTRVKLKRKGSDYINANYINGVEGTRYIATQAPLPSTFEDFWLMVYQQKTHVIAMLTNLQEKGMIKAEMYWPEKRAQWVNYGDLSVMMERERRISEELTLRFFRIKHKNKGERSVIQIHYTGWPDFGTPDNTDTFHLLLDLLDKYNAEDSDAGPMVIHCSAGIGRTGTLIAAHMARGMKATETKTKNNSVKDIVKSMREDRAGMVQSFAQYKFLVHVVKEM